jgi:hypothetical protein
MNSATPASAEIQDGEFRVSIDKLDASSPDCISETVFALCFKYDARIKVRTEKADVHNGISYIIRFKEPTTNSRAPQRTNDVFTFGSSLSPNILNIAQQPRDATVYIDAVTLYFKVTAFTIDIVYAFKNNATFHRKTATELRDSLLRAVVNAHNFYMPLILTRKRKATAADANVDADAEAKADSED